MPYFKIDEDVATLILIIASLVFIVGAYAFITWRRRALRKKKNRSSRITWNDPFEDTVFGRRKNNSHN